jgi:hypothetical protein
VELLEKAKTWWETLGISKQDADIVEGLLPPEFEERLKQPLCQNCGNRIDPKSFHDCCGVYDEVRYRLNDTLARSTRNRLMKKYGGPWDEMSTHVDKFFEKNAERIPHLIAEFEKMRKNDAYRQKLLEINWDKDEELWNS